MKFGPISERELDIAEWVFIQAFNSITAMTEAGFSPALVRESLDRADDTRDQLRAKIETA